MKDYIDLVEKIRSFACKYYPNCEGCNTMGHECRSAIERQAADAIEELSHSVDLLGNANRSLMAAVPEWISVEERLPEEKINPNTTDFEWVLCATVFGDVRAYKYGTPIGQKEAHFWQGLENIDAYITHWMPLPEPPKEKGGDQD